MSDAERMATEARAYAESVCWQDENIPMVQSAFRMGWKAAREAEGADDE